MKVILEEVVKRFGSATVVKGANLEIHSGEMFFLLGSSGCGKTTILRMLAGFYEPDEGEIFFGDDVINGVPPHNRNAGLVFQNYAVWPHMSVFENVAYGLRVRKLSESDIQKRVGEILKKVRMDEYSDRKPSSLSGGQQQRVALARAIVVKPDLLLFDEPLCNLDAKLRIEMRAEIGRLHQETNITSVYVTHDQEEALSLADRIAVMSEGAIQQVGTPYEVYNEPKNPFVASFIGEMNFYGESSSLGRMLEVEAGGRVGFRPERVKIDGDGLGVTVISSSYLGSKNECILKSVDGDEIKAWLPGYVKEGEDLKIFVEARDLVFFGKEHA